MPSFSFKYAEGPSAENILWDCPRYGCHICCSVETFARVRTVSVLLLLLFDQLSCFSVTRFDLILTFWLLWGQRNKVSNGKVAKQIGNTS